MDEDIRKIICNIDRTIMCIYPKLIRNPKYKENKKNGGVIPAVLDMRMLMLPIGCNKCMDCMKEKARNWQSRIIEDIKENKNGKFVTLTFSNEGLKEVDELVDKNIIGYSRDNAVATIAVRRFLERWRKEHKVSVRHWLITELGHNGTENIHLHGILWCNDVEKIERIWKYGKIWKGKVVNERIINYVNARTAGYITKYMTKVDMKHKYYRSIVLCSKGIGKNYVEKNKKKKDYYTTDTGNKIGLNIYWRNKIFSEEERERMWIEKLDEGVRYIGKQKFDARDAVGILSALENRRLINKELGYSDGSIDWKEKDYEENMRVINQGKRKDSVGVIQKNLDNKIG